MKICFKCGIEKPRSEFYAHKMMADGLLGKCKECTKAAMRARWAAMPDEAKARDNAVRKERPGYRERADAQTKRYIAANPAKLAARKAVTRAVMAGKLIRQPCVVCGAALTLGHHESYAKERRLEVVWLCHKHHVARHREMLEIGADPMAGVQYENRLKKTL